VFLGMSVPLDVRVDFGGLSGDAGFGWAEEWWVVMLDASV